MRKGCFLWVVLVGVPALADDLAPEARAVMAEYQKSASVIQGRADQEILVLKRQFAPKLKALQDKYCRAAKLDEALAVREALRQLLGVQPDPGLFHATPEEIGKVLFCAVTGSVEGSVWGTGVFTSDSKLAAAAVHASVLKPGEKGVVRVTVLAGQSRYAPSTANGVTSLEYGPWNVSFSVESAKELQALAP
jgi:hypothetical protein